MHFFVVCHVACLRIVIETGAILEAMSGLLYRFSDGAYFSRKFKEHYGMPPMEYRKKNQPDRTAAVTDNNVKP